MKRNASGIVVARLPSPTVRGGVWYGPGRKSLDDSTKIEKKPSLNSLNTYFDLPNAKMLHLYRGGFVQVRQLAYN